MTTVQQSLSLSSVVDIYQLLREISVSLAAKSSLSWLLNLSEQLFRALSLKAAVFCEKKRSENVPKQ